MKREMQRDKETLQERKQMFGRETRNYFLDEDKIDIYRNYYADKPDTIFREETDEAAKKREVAATMVLHLATSLSPMMQMPRVSPFQTTI